MNQDTKDALKAAVVIVGAVGVLYAVRYAFIIFSLSMVC